MHNKSFQDLIAPSFFPQLNTIRKLGNDAVHTNKCINPTEVLHVVKLLHGFMLWVVNIYGEARVARTAFDASLIPAGDVVEKTKEELRKIETAYMDSREKLKQLAAELKEIKALKTHNLTTTPPPIDPNEALTRSIYINSLLREAS